MKTIFRSACKSHFVQLPNQMLRDNSISLRARGLLAMVLTYQEDWVITKAWIEEKVPEGKQAISSTFRELESAGYAIMTEQRDVETGKIASKTWTFHDSPVPERERSTATSRPGDRKPECGNPPSGNPECGNPESGKAATTNTMGNEHHVKEDNVSFGSNPPETRKRTRNILLDALALTAEGTVLDEVPEGAWSGIAKSLKEIKAVCPDLTPQEIERRAKNLTLHFHYMKPSPQVLAKYWGQIGSPPKSQISTATSLNRDIELVRNSEAFPGGVRWFTEHSKAEKDAYLAARAHIEAIDPHFNFQELKR